MATYTINQNVNTAIIDFGMIKQAIVDKGVSVPTGTPTSQYASKIASIPSGGGGTEENFLKTLNRPSNAEITIPNGATNIPENLFAEYEDLSKINLPNSITSIGGYAFSNCKNLILTALPTSLTSLEYDCFYNCWLLNIDTIPASVETIGAEAFMGCKGLTTLTFLGTPDSIEGDAFRNCSNLTAINVPWSSGDISDAPWGANNATIVYDYTS